MSKNAIQFFASKKLAYKIPCQKIILQNLPCKKTTHKIPCQKNHTTKSSMQKKSHIKFHVKNFVQKTQLQNLACQQNSHKTHQARLPNENGINSSQCFNFPSLSMKREGLNSCGLSKFYKIQLLTKIFQK
jgi:hypothetical protein